MQTVVEFSVVASNFIELWRAGGKCPIISRETDALLENLLSWSQSHGLAITMQAVNKTAEPVEIIEAEELCSFLNTLTACARLPPTVSALGCQADERAASWSRRYLASIVGACSNLLSSVCSHGRLDRVKSALKACMPSLLYICGSHWDSNSAWCSVESSRKAHELCTLLCSLDNSDCLAAMLRGSCGKSLLDLVCRHVSKGKWRDYVQSVEVLLWYAGEVCSDGLEDELSQLMAALLLLVDEGEACLDLSMRGAIALRRLVDSVTEAELCRHNRLLVLYDAIKRHTYSRDPDFLSVILPLHIILSSMMSSQHGFSSSHSNQAPGSFHNAPCIFQVAGLEWNQLDDFIEHLLFSASSESRWDLRRVYIMNIHAVLFVLGSRAVRHLHRLTDLILIYLELPDMPDEECRFATLAILRQCILMAWPRLSKPSSIIKALLKLSGELTVDTSDSAKVPVRGSESHPEFSVKFCSNFEFINSLPACSSLAEMVLKEVNVDRTTSYFLLLAALECLLLLARCSEGTMTMLKLLHNDVDHAGVRQCLKYVTEFDAPNGS